MNFNISASDKNINLEFDLFLLDNSVELLLGFGILSFENGKDSKLEEIICYIFFLFYYTYLVMNNDKMKVAEFDVEIIFTKKEEGNGNRQSKTELETPYLQKEGKSKNGITKKLSQSSSSSSTTILKKQPSSNTRIHPPVEPPLHEYIPSVLHTSHMPFLPEDPLSVQDIVLVY
jgi:hypothetical protein